MKMPSVEMKKIVGRNILLSYSNSNEIFIFYIDARKMQPRRVIIGKWEFHYLLLTQVYPRLLNYTKTLRKLLSIVENLKDNYVSLY